MTPVSRRQFLLNFGMNSHTFSKLVAEGAIKVHVTHGARSSITVLEHSLVEGKHFVRCLECGSHQGMIAPRHLTMCCGLTIEQYVGKHPASILMSSFCTANKTKTQEQKNHQSETLLRRFQTPEGQITRQEISEASKRMQDSGYREVASAHLRKINTDPKLRDATSKRSTLLWSTPAHRERIREYVDSHRVELADSAAHARSHIVKRLSKPHALVKAALVSFGLEGFLSEYSIGYYCIDEALPTIKVAVEVDGCYWHGCVKCGLEPRPEMRALDKRKTTYLVNRGWIVLRLLECDIHRDLNACVEQVMEVVRVRRANQDPTSLSV